jgi:hypothetical protein
MAEQFLPNIFGAYDTRDNLDVPIEEYTEERAAQDIAVFAARFNEVVEQTVNLISVATTKAVGSTGTIGGGEMQPYVEKGDTEATRGGEEWNYAVPIDRFRDRQIYTEEFIATNTMDVLNRDVVMSAIRNGTTRIKQVLRAVLHKTNYTFRDGEFPGSGLGNLAVKRLFNNDSATGSIYVGATEVSIGTLQHYITSGGASIAEDDFGAAKDKLKAVGLGTDVVYIMGSALGEDTAGLTNFVYPQERNIVDPDAVYSIVRHPRAIGRLRGAGIEGEVIVMPFFPDNVFLAIDRAAPVPVLRRQHVDPRFRGWRLVQNETLAPYGTAAIRNKRWEFIEGAAVGNRANGVSVEITADASYDDPTI